MAPANGNLPARRRLTPCVIGGVPSPRDARRALDHESGQVSPSGDDGTVSALVGTHPGEPTLGGNAAGSPGAARAEVPSPGGRVSSGPPHSCRERTALLDRDECAARSLQLRTCGGTLDVDWWGATRARIPPVSKCRGPSISWEFGTEREKESLVAVATDEFFRGWRMTCADRRSCFAIVEDSNDRAING